MNIVLFTQEELGKPLSATDRRTKHITSILRLGPGDRFRAGVIGGVPGTATVGEIAPDGTLGFEFEADPRGDGAVVGLEPVQLLLGHPRPIVLKRMLREISALGIERVVVVRTELGEKSYFESNLWTDGTVEQLLIEGAEQAGSTMLPTIERAWTVARGIDRIVDGWTRAERVVFDNAVEAPAAPAASPRPKSQTPGEKQRGGAPRRVIAVGAERGWTDGERGVFAGEGFEKRYLSERVLRTETAAVVAVALSLRELNRW